MYRSEAAKRKCTADNHKCEKLPMFVGTNIDTGLQNEVACVGHVWLLSDPGYDMILEDPTDDEFSLSEFFAGNIGMDGPQWGWFKFVMWMTNGEWPE